MGREVRRSRFTRDCGAYAEETAAALAYIQAAVGKGAARAQDGPRLRERAADPEAGLLSERLERCPWLSTSSYIESDLLASVLKAASSLSLIAKALSAIVCNPFGGRSALRCKAGQSSRAPAVANGCKNGAPSLSPRVQQQSPLGPSRPLQAASSEPAPVPNVCVVTGGTGFVGQRLVEMLVERGAKKVISLDIVPPPKDAWQHPAIDWRVCDVTDKEGVSAAIKGADCVWHNAAAVGPFHPTPLYTRVNYEGTLNVLDACRKHGVPKLVFSSSPSTRFTGADVDGLREDEMPSLPLKSYLQEYAATKARSEPP